MNIDNKIIDTPIYDIILKLKSELAKKGINRFNNIKQCGNDIQVTCPIHKNGAEKKPSAGITTVDSDKTPAGTIHCFTCGYIASLPKLVEDCFDIHTQNNQWGKDWILDNFLYNELLERKSLEITQRKKVTPRQYVSEAELEQYRYYHPYMYKRKLTDEIITKFDVGYDKNTNCITFPTNDEYGNCLFITRRNVDKKFFNYPRDACKPVYGLDKLPKDCKQVIVCESIINALTCWVYGIPAVALLGLGTSEQYKILQKSGIRKYLLGFDGDDAGDRGAKSFTQNMHNYAKIVKLNVPRGKDINDLSKEEFEKLLENT